jgi:hypothetical protein
VAERSSTSPSDRPRPSGQGPARPAGKPPAAGGGLPLWAVAAIVIVVGFLVWFLFIRDDDSSDSGSSTGSQATKTVDLASAQGLPAEVADVGHPVYWLGPKPGVNYEVTNITDGRTYVRYLPAGVEAESESPYLTVGSYGQANAFDVLKGLAKGPGHTVTIPNGGLALTNGPKAQGVYVAYPGVDTQIEIFDPQLGHALDLAKSGALTQVK